MICRQTIKLEAELLSKFRSDYSLSDSDDDDDDGFVEDLDDMWSSTI